MRPTLSLVRGVTAALCLFVIAAAAAQTGDSKAMKYHAALVKRPNPGYLYDRFYNTWLDTGTLDELRQFLQQRVEDNNTTADRLLLAFFYTKQGDDVQALQQFRTALANDPGNAHTWYQKAAVEARTLDFETAIKDLDVARKAEPDEKLAVAIAKLQGKLFVRNRQTQQALAVWKELLDANPQDEDLYEDIIELQISEGLFDEAAALAQRLVAQTADKYKQVIRRVRIGDIHQRSGQRTKALEVYGKTLEDVGHGTWLEREILAQIEQLFRREDDLTGLQEHYQKLIGQYAKRIEIHKRYARLLSELGENDEAVKQFEEILRLTPGDRGNSEAYVALLADTDHLPKAIQVVGTLIQQHPRDGELRLRLAGLHERAGDKQAAGDAVGQYLEVSDKSEYAHLRAARLLKQFKLFDAAEKTYEQLVAAFPDSVAAQEARAAFLYERDKKDEALAIWRRLAAGKGRSELVHVARILAARNEHQAAFELLDAREEDFADDSIYLGQLVTAAIALKKFDEAAPWAQRRVQLARTTADLETAIGQAAQVIDKADRLETTIQTMAAAQRRSPQETCLLAELIERTGDSQRADRVLAEIDDQQDLLVVSQQVRLFSQRRAWTKAAEAIRRLVELPEGRKSIYVRRLVELYQRDYKNDEALRWVQEWKKLSPGSTMPWLTESRLLVQQGKMREAINALRAAVAEFEDDPDVRAQLAKLYVDDGKLADAERLFWRLYEDGKDLTSKLRWVQQLAEVAQLQGTEETLIEKFDERRRTNRQSIEPLLALSEIYRVGGDYEDRRNALLEATRIKPDDLQLLRQIARIEETEGDWQRALATLERAAKLDSTTRTREQIARIYLNYGDADKGYAVLHELAGQQKSDARSVEGIAEAMMSVRDWERAAKFLAPLMAQYPDDYRLRYLYSVALEEAGKTDEAVESFLVMLGMKKEIPGSFAQAPQTPWSGYLSPLAALMPQESVEYMELTWSSRIIYSYKNQGGPGLAMAGYRGLPSGAITMPHDVTAVRQFALAHLMSINQFHDEDEQTALSQALQSAGVTNAEVLLKITPDANNPESMMLLAQEHPDDKGLMALFLLMSMQGLRGEAELCVRGYELFKDERPQLGLIAAAQAAARDEKHLHLLDAAMAELPQIEQPNLFTVMAIAMATGADFNGPATETALPEAYKKKLLDQIVAWYPKLSNLGPQGLMVFYMVANALAAGDDPSAFFAFLDNEVKRWPNGGGQKSTNNLMGMFGGRGGGLAIRPLGFPPDTLPSFPPQVRGLLAGGRAPFGGGRIGGGRIAADWDEATVTKSLAAVKDPALKILLAHRFDVPALVEPTLDEMLRAEQPNLDALLMAAGKATEDENYEIAAELLDKSRYLPMTRDVRKRVDGALVALAMERVGQDMAGPDEAAQSGLAAGFKQALAALARLSGGTTSKPEENVVLAAGRGAALRLRRAAVTAEERQQLVAALAQLGLQDEADKLEQSVTATAGGVYSAGGFSAPARSVNTQTDRITELVSEGKQDQAVRAIVNDLKLHAQNALSQSGSMNYNQYEIRQLRGLIQSHGLGQQVLAEMDPGESASPLRLGQYGVACEIMGEKEKARKIYEAALAKNDKNDGVRIRLVTLLAGEDPKAAGAHLEKVSPRSVPQMCRVLTTLVSDGNTELRTRLQLAQILTQFLAQQQDTEKTDLSWATALANALGQEQYQQRGSSLPSLYAVSTDDGQLEEGAKEANALRRKAYDELCRTMLEIPQLAPDGFTRLLAAAERDEEVTDEFAKLALDALLTHKPLRGTVAQQSYYNAYAGPFGDSGDGTVRFRTPQEFLVRHAWKTNNLALITDQVVPQLEKASKSEQAQQLKESLQLYTCKEDDFPAEAKAYVARQTKNRFRGLMPDDTAMSKVVEIWQDRKLKVDLQPLIADRLRDAANSRYSNDTPAYVVAYAVALGRDGKSEEVDAFLNMLAETLIGPKEQWAEIIKKHYVRNHIQSGTVNARIHQFTQLMQAMVEHRELVFSVFDLSREVGLVQDIGRNTYSIRQFVSGSSDDGAGATDDGTGDADDKGRVAEQIVKFLETSPFVADLDDFRVYDISGEGEAQTVLATVLDALNNHEESLAKEIRKRLEARQPATFGTGLLIACLSQDASVPVSTLEYLAKHEQDLKSQPKEKQAALAALIEQLESSQSGFEVNLSDAAKQTRTWLHGLGAERREALAKRILTAKRLADLNTDQYRLTQEIGPIIADTIDSDPKKATALFDKTIELVSSSPQRRRYPFDANNQMTAGLLRQVVNQRQDLATMAFAMDIMLDKERPAFDGAWLRYSTDAPVSAAHQLPLNRLEGDAQSQLKVIQSVYTTFGEKLSPRPTTIFAAAFGGLLQNCPDDQRPEVLAWLESEAKDGEYPAIAREMIAGAQLVAASQTPSDDVFDEYADDPFGAGFSVGGANARPEIPERFELADYHRHYMAVLDNDELPLTWRLTVVELLLSSQSMRLPAEAVWSCAKVMQQAYEAKTVLQHNRAGTLLAELLLLPQDEAWQEAAGGLAAAWNKRHLQPAARAASPARYYSSDTPESALMLKLNLLLGNEQDVVQILRHYEHELSNNLGVFSVLVRHGRDALAAKMLRIGWDQLGAQTDQVTMDFYDRALDEVLPSFLETISNEDLRYVAKLLLVTLPDTADEAKRAETDCEGRIQQAAEKFAQLKFVSPAMKERALLLISRSEKGADVVAEPLAAAAQKVNLAALLELDNDQLRQRKQKLVIRFVELAFRKGDFAAVLAATGGLDQAGVAQDYEARQIRNTIGEAICQIAVRHWTEWTPEQFVAMLPVTRRMATPTNQHDYYLDQFAALNIMAHVLAGRTGELRSWGEELTDDQKGRLLTVGTHVWYLAKRTVGEPSAEDLPRRVELTTDILKTAEPFAWIRTDDGRRVYSYGRRGQRELVEAISTSGLLTRDEFVSHGPAIAEAAPVGGLIWAALAEAQASADQPEAAAASWAKAVETAPADDKLRQTAWRIHQAKVLAQLKRADEAKAVLDGLDADLVHEFFQAALDELRKQLE